MSILQIARAANVSYATAWRIINKQRGTSQTAVAAVERAIGQLGYDPVSTTRRGRPPRAADGIRTRNIALLHFRQASSISASVLSCVQRILADQDLNLIFAHCTNATELPPAVKSGNVDGVLGYGQFPADTVERNLRKIPAVWMMTRTDDTTDSWGDRVRPDHQEIGRIAAMQLLRHGHKSIAFFNPRVGFNVYQQRFASFRAACAASGIDAQLYCSNGQAKASAADTTDQLNLEAQNLVDQWMDAASRATGLFVPVDRVTLFVYRHLERRGVQPGRDVEIVSCDNERELLSLMNPAPASIDLNREMIARLAVERLLWRMKNGLSTPSIAISVSPTLVNGGNVQSGFDLIAGNRSAS